MPCYFVPHRISTARLGPSPAVAAVLHSCILRLLEGAEPMDYSEYANKNADELFDCNDPDCESASDCLSHTLSDAFELSQQLECGFRWLVTVTQSGATQ